MSDAMIQTLSTGLFGALAAFELVAAGRSWIAARNTRQPMGERDLWLSDRGAIRDHVVASRRHVNVLRSQYPILRTRQHGQRIRRTIKQLARFPEVHVGCLACRDSRLRGRPRCLDCGRPLVAPLQEARA